MINQHLLIRNYQLILTESAPSDRTLYPSDHFGIAAELEIPGGEYDDKMTKYAEMGVLYYTIYNSDYWKRDKHDPFEVYRLERGAYVRQRGNPVWMPEIELGIGYEQGTHEGWSRKWLYWYDEQGNRFPALENAIEQERLRAE